MEKHMKTRLNTIILCPRVKAYSFALFWYGPTGNWHGFMCVCNMHTLSLTIFNLVCIELTHNWNVLEGAVVWGEGGSNGLVMGHLKLCYYKTRLDHKSFDQMLKIPIDLILHKILTFGLGRKSINLFFQRGSCLSEWSPSGWVKTTSRTYFLCSGL